MGADVGVAAGEAGAGDAAVQDIEVGRGAGDGAAIGCVTRVGLFHRKADRGLGMAWLADGACVELARLWGRNGKWDDDDDDDDDDDGGDDNGGDDGWTARRFGKQMFLSVDVAGGFMSGEQGLLGA